MGDVAMTVPVVRAFCNQFPNVKVTVLTRHAFNSFFRDMPQVKVINADVKNKHNGLMGLYKLSKELKYYHFDGLVDLHNVLRSNILKFFLSIERCVQLDKGRTEKKALISGRIFEQLKTMHQRYADAFRALGYNIDLSKPSYPKRQPLNKALKKLIKISSKKTIGIAPFAAHKSKMYPLESMTEVIQELSKDYTVLLFGGGKKEEAKLEILSKKFKSVINISGKLSMNQELDVISNLDLMLSMDSGNGHIAAMLGVKVITIWGVTHPFTGFIPFNQSLDSCLTVSKTKFPKIPTSAYGNKYPKNYEAVISSILPTEITDKVKYWFEKSN